jgi:hypothetical protein
MEPLVNKVTESAIEVFNLEELVQFDDIAELDIAQFLDRGIILREKEFRQNVKQFDWTLYARKHVAVVAPSQAIIPTWAFMLISSVLSDIAASTLRGDKSNMIQVLYRKSLDEYEWSVYQDKIVVIKGCGSELVPEDAYAYATVKLKSYARKIMFGEPCSSVPIWRRPKVTASSS